MNKKNDNWDIEKELWNIVKEQISELENHEKGELAFFNYWKEERKFKDLINEHLKCKYGKYFTDEVKEERESIVQQIYNSFLFKFANRFYKRTELIGKSLEDTIVNKNKFKDGKEYYESEVQRLNGNKILFEYISDKKKENDNLRNSKNGCEIKKKSVKTLLIEALNDKFLTDKKHIMDIARHNKANKKIKNNEELLFKTIVNTLRIKYGNSK